METVKTDLPKNEVLKKYGLREGTHVIALLPGSRISEVKSLLKAMVGAAKIIDRELGDVQTIVVRRPGLPDELYKPALTNSAPYIKISDGDVYSILGAADFAIVKSGTATLETAIMGVPFIITYKTNLINYIAYKIVARIKVLGLVNVIAGRVIVPELLQYDATPEKLAGTSLEILRNEKKRTAMLSELKKIKDSLGTPGASMRAAQAILPYLQ